MTSSATPNDDPDSTVDVDATTTTTTTRCPDNTAHHHPRRSSSKKNHQMMHRLLRHELYLESAYLLLGGTTMMISSYCNQLFPRALGQYIDQRSSSLSSLSSTRSDTNNDKSSDPNVCWYIPFGILLLLGGVASGVRTLSLQLAAHRIASRLKQYLYTALLLPPTKDKDDNDDDEPPPTTTTIPTTTTTTNNHTAATASSSLSPAYVTSILTTDVEQISQMVTSQLVNTLRSASATLFSLYHMLRISPRLVLTTITIIPTLGIGTLILNRYLKRAQPSPQAAMEYVEDRLTHTHLIHQYDRARDEIYAHQQQLVRDYGQYGLPAALLNGARMTFMFWSGSGTLLYVLHCGTTTTTTTRGTPISGGQLTSFTSYALLFGLGCSGLLKSHQERHAILTGAWQRYGSMLLGRCGEEETMILPTQCATQPDPVEPPNDDQSPLVEAVTSIDIRDVSFAYPPRHDHSDDATIDAIDNNNESKNDTFVLRNISLTVPKGSVVALVGPNGAGKSTLVHLLLGHDRPTTGSIHAVMAADSNETTHHHIPYHQMWSPRVQNQLVQVVPQATSLLNMSIYDNVHYSNKYATHLDVMTALQDADCYPWKTSTHQGGDGNKKLDDDDDDDEKLLRQTKVGKNGSLLSGGERQKIGLARALLNNPHFLVLDEPTTHIDQNSNTKIANRIVRRRRGQEQSGDKRGILLITHDVKTMLEYQVDYVYVMKEGQIVEHNTLEILQCDRQSELCQLMPKLYHPTTD